MRSAPAMREVCGREQQTGRDRALRSGGEASASGIAVQPGTTGVGDGAPPPPKVVLQASSLRPASCPAAGSPGTPRYARSLILAGTLSESRLLSLVSWSRCRGKGTPLLSWLGFPQPAPEGPEGGSRRHTPIPRQPRRPSPAPIPPLAGRTVSAESDAGTVYGRQDAGTRPPHRGRYIPPSERWSKAPQGHTRPVHPVFGVGERPSPDSGLCGRVNSGVVLRFPSARPGRGLNPERRWTLEPVPLCNSDTVWPRGAMAAAPSTPVCRRAADESLTATNPGDVRMGGRRRGRAVVFPTGACIS